MKPYLESWRKRRGAVEFLPDAMPRKRAAAEELDGRAKKAAKGADQGHTSPKQPETKPKTHGNWGETDETKRPSHSAGRTTGDRPRKRKTEEPAPHGANRPIVVHPSWGRGEGVEGADVDSYKTMIAVACDCPGCGKWRLLPPKRGKEFTGTNPFHCGDACAGGCEEDLNPDELEYALDHGLPV